MHDTLDRWVRTLRSKATDDDLGLPDSVRPPTLPFRLHFPPFVPVRSLTPRLDLGYPYRTSGTVEEWWRVGGRDYHPRGPPLRPRETPARFVRTDRVSTSSSPRYPPYDGSGGHTHTQDGTRGLGYDGARRRSL